MLKIKKFIKDINNKKSKIAIIGLGYIGLPLALTTALNGYQTIGLDINQKKIKALLKGKSYIKDIPNNKLIKVINNNTFIPTNNYELLKKINIIIICLPTPLTKRKKPNLTAIYNALKKIKKYAKKNSLIIIESTTYPTFTEKVNKNHLKDNYYLAFSPERIDPTNKQFNLENTPRVIGGINQESTLLAKSFYNNIIKAQLLTVSNPTTAEMSKLLENTYRLVNIALISEFTKTCQLLKINIWEVIEAAKSKPYGFQPFYPNVGVGGHCIPIDPIYLNWLMKKKKLNLPLINLSIKITKKMPYLILKIIKQILKKEKIKKAKILIIGITYKKDTTDLRESPTLKLIFGKLLRLLKVNPTVFNLFILISELEGIVFLLILFI